MSCLYISTCYGYTFKSYENLDFEQWAKNKENEDLIDNFKLNRYEIKENAKICIDDENYTTFVKKLDNEVLCVYEGCMFPVGDQFRVSDASFVEVEKDFEQMLKDTNTPEVFRNRDNWEFVGTIFSVTS